MQRFAFKSLLVTFALILVPAIGALGQAGFLDATFGGTGMAQIGFGGAEEIAGATAIHTNGLVLVAGLRQDTAQIFVVRLGTNNLPDPAFGSGGMAAVTPPSGVYQVSAMAVQADGKIVVAGEGEMGSFDTYTMTRLNSDGSLDTSFGSGGFVYRNLTNQSDDRCTCMAIQPDGKIVLAGQSVTSANFNPTYNLSLARFDTNGYLDSSFGIGGVAIYTSGNVANSILLEGDGNILLSSGDGIVRYTTNGVVDTSFGPGGQVNIPTGSQINALVLQPAGIQVGQNAMIIAAGYSSGGALVARLSLSGTLDTSFNSVGYVSKSIGSNPRVNGVRCFASGFNGRVFKFVISGYTDGGNHFFTARLNADGSTDTTFGTSGFTLASVPGDTAVNNALTVAGGPLLVQVGTRTISSNCASDIVVTRYVYSTGLLDTNFYGTGILVTNIGDRVAEANSVAIQPDGKIVLAGYCINACGSSVMTLCRLNSDGSFDTSFGTGGKVVTASSPQASQQTPMVIQPDGRIVVAGSAILGLYSSILVERFLTNGTLDSSFGTGGMVQTAVGTNSSYPSSIALQSDGKIIVAGNGSQSGNDIAIVRYNTDGSLDTSWNGTGKLLTVVGSTFDLMAALAVQPDGKIINAGGSSFGNVAKFSMLRCTTNGALDNSFGSLGKVATTIPNSVSVGYAMTLQSDHKIILAGVSVNTSVGQYELALVRYNTNATLDTTFGSSGIVISPIGLANSAAYSVAVQRDGKIVAGCRAQNGPYYKFAVARFLTNGTTDSTYGYGGLNFFDYASGADEDVNAMALDPLGRAVLAGKVGNVFGVLRVTGDPALRFTSINRLPNQHILVGGQGVPSASHSLLKSATANGHYTFLSSFNTDANGNWQFDDSSGTGSTIGFYRFSYP